MSYSDAARSSGPTGKPDKLPEVPSLNSTSNPKGSVEVIPEEKLKEFEPKAEDDRKSKIKADLSEQIDKELAKAKDRGDDFKSYFEKFLAKASDAFKCFSQSAHKVGLKATDSTKSLAKKTGTELQNPVVVAQVLAGIGGAVAGYYGYLERNRIDYSNKLTLAIHGSIITGLVLLDGYLFNTFYPKYKK